VIHPIKGDRGLGPSKVLRGSRTHDVDRLVHKFKLMPGLVGDGSVVDQYDRLLRGEGRMKAFPLGRPRASCPW
jgi:hypothetical protein